jgi:outer membrane protein
VLLGVSRRSRVAARIAPVSARATPLPSAPMRARRHRFIRCAVGLSLAGVVPIACQSPLASSADERLSDAAEPILRASSERQLAQVAPGSARSIGPVETDVDRMLAPRRDELLATGPQSAALGNTVAGTVPLTGETPQRVVLSLRAAVLSAVRNNLNAETARLEQAITAADVTRAEAAFDWVLGAGAGFERVDQPGIGVLFPGSTTTVIPNVTNQRNWSFDAGIGRTLDSGGRVSLSAASSRIDNLGSNLFVPDPAWQSAVTLGLSQPLLRGFGSDVARAEVRLAENRDRLAQEAMRGELLSVVARAEQAYWALVSARARLVSAEWLVTVGEEVRDVLAKRREFDATLAQYANAVATVEARKALVIEARRSLSEAGNRLKAIINDPELPVGGEVDVVPADAPSDAPFVADLRKSIETALANAPSVQQALIAIESAGIGVTVADNARLPQLDLNANIAWFGLRDDFGDSYGDIADGDFVNYVAGLRFSQALGNRAADSTYREARLRRSQAVVAYDRAVQSTVLAVKNALTDCVAYRELAEQNRTFRLAQAENLRALLVDERTLAALTPEFLQLKFQLQNGLALAEDQYFASLVGYQNALAALAEAMGTGLEANQIEFTPATDAGK